MTRPHKARLRITLNDHAGSVVLICLVFAGVGGYLSFSAYGQANTATEPVQTSSWESSARFSYNATVTDPAAAFDPGEQLSDKREYIRSVAPILNGSLQYSYTASESGTLNVSASPVVVLQSVSDQREGPRVEYWRLDSAIAESNTAELSPGESLAVPFELNVSAAAQRLETVDERVGGTPGEKKLVVAVETQKTGTLNGEQINETTSYTLPISVDENTYRVDDPGPVTEGDSQTAQRTVATDPGPLAGFGGPLLLVLGVVGVGVGGYGRYISVSKRERDWLAYRNAREEFADWITVAQVVEDDLPAPSMLMETLVGLVDIAVDTDNRVIEERSRDRFLIFDGETLYAYDPPAAPEYIDRPHQHSVTDGRATQIEPSDGQSAADEQFVDIPVNTTTRTEAAVDAVRQQYAAPDETASPPDSSPVPERESRLLVGDGSGEASISYGLAGQYLVPDEEIYLFDPDAVLQELTEPSADSVGDDPAEQSSQRGKTESGDRLGTDRNADQTTATGHEPTISIETPRVAGQTQNRAELDRHRERRSEFSERLNQQLEQLRETVAARGDTDQTRRQPSEPAGEPTVEYYRRIAVVARDRQKAPSVNATTVEETAQQYNRAPEQVVTDIRDHLAAQRSAVDGNAGRSPAASESADTASETATVASTR